MHASRDKEEISLPGDSAPDASMFSNQHLPELLDEAEESEALEAQNESRIGLNDINFLALIEKTTTAKIALVEINSTKKIYACKIFRKDLLIHNDEMELPRTEKRVLTMAAEFKHPFICQLVASFQTTTRLYLLTEYYPGGDLMHHLQKRRFTEQEVLFYSGELCLAIKYLHENGIIYRGMKLDNILLQSDGHVKLIDFSICKEDVWFGSTTSSFCGTAEFMAPEMLLDKPYGREIDWWGFGVLVYQMLFQQSPFRGEDEDEIYDAILAGEPLYPDHAPQNAREIIRKLLERTPSQRLGSGPTDAEEIMADPWYKDMNWDDLYNKKVAPPFIPIVSSQADTSNFDNEYTSVTPTLTPIQTGVLSQAMQEEFRDFSWIGPDA